MGPRYACLDPAVVRRGERSLRALSREDMIPIMHWRNAQLEVLRQPEPLTLEQQERYFGHVVLPSFAEAQPRQILLAYLLGEALIGYGGLVHIAWPDRRAEVSFLVDPARAAVPEIYAEDFACYLDLIREVAFRHLGFTRLFTETFDIRPLHVSLLERHGFEFEGRMRAHVWINGQPVDSLIHGCLNLPSGSGQSSIPSQP